MEDSRFSKVEKPNLIMQSSTSSRALVVDKKPQKPRTTTSTLLPSGIVTHEQVLQVLAGAMKKAAEPGLDKFEIMRLKVLVDAAKTYDSVLEKFER